MRPECSSRQSPTIKTRIRGFTLIELTTVVVIIAIFSALALPQLVRHLESRRVSETAQRIADLYRGARMRAMGQGGAVLVRYQRASIDNQGLFIIRDRVTGVDAQGRGCAHTPSPRCDDPTGDSWDNLVDQGVLTGQARSVSQLELALEHWLGDVVASADFPIGTEVGNLDVCFTPMGRTFVRVAGNFAPMAQIPRIRVQRIVAGAPTGLTREVLVLPGGLVRTRTPSL